VVISFIDEVFELLSQSQGQYQKSTPRIQCAATLDPWMFPILHSTIPEIICPFLTLNSDLWQKPDDLEKIQHFCSTNIQRASVVTLNGTSHFNFTDLYYWTSSWYGSLIPRRYLAEECGKEMLGPADTAAVLQLIAQILILFFEKSLLAESQALVLPESSFYKVEMKKD
jgi:hypothetical protein